LIVQEKKGKIKLAEAGGFRGTVKNWKKIEGIRVIRYKPILWITFP
jgi:hypothetical protein